MPIRWSALKISEAADMMEEFIKQAAEPLEQVRTVAEAARQLPNLPQYIDQDLLRIIGEVERAIGGGQFEPIGRLNKGISSLRKDLPEGAVEGEKVNLKHGATASML